MGLSADDIQRMTSTAIEPLPRIVSTPSSSGTTQSYAKFLYTVASGTDGGTATATTWVTRPINTEETDADGIGTLASNQIFLGGGTYRTLIVCVGYHLNGRWANRLRNVTDGTTILTSTSGYGVDGMCPTVIQGQFTIVSGKALEVQHYATSTQNTNGLGANVGTGEKEVFTVAEFWKVG